MSESERDEVRIMGDAAEIQDPAARNAYLDQACVGKPELRGRIESLLSVQASEPVLKSGEALGVGPQMSDHCG